MLWARIQTEFHGNQRAVVQSLADKGALARRASTLRPRDGHPVERSTTPPFYALLAGERGWSAEQYERWLGDLLCSQLLGLDT